MPEEVKKEYGTDLNRNEVFKMKWDRRIQKASVRVRPRTPNRPHNINERLHFRRVHRVETVQKQEALKKGYPMDIDFKALSKRILSFQDSLINIAKGALDSLFLKAEREFNDENGLIKSRSIFGQFSRFHRASASYYGNRGSQLILTILQRELIMTNRITYQDTKPILPLTFVQNILVPETCIRLIQEDYKNISYESAADILFKSQDFGSRVHHEPQDEDDDV